MRLEPEERTDVYYTATSNVGVKLRERPDGNNNFEVKFLLTDHGVHNFQVCAGRIESWAKLAIAKAIVPDAHEPSIRQLRIVVEKSRLLRKFEFATENAELKEVRPHAIVRAGCAAELTWITVEGVRFWTFGFEAFWQDAKELQALQPVLDTTIAYVLTSPDPALTIERSSSYPAWLQLYHENQVR